MTLKVKNQSGEDKTYGGVSCPDATTTDIITVQQRAVAQDSSLRNDSCNGSVVINDGTGDFINNSAIDYLNLILQVVV